MHQRSYYDSVLAIEMKNKIPSLSSTMMLIQHQWLLWNSSFFSLRCWFLFMTSLAVTSSMLETSVKFWGTSFKFWLRPWENYDVFATFITENFNNLIEISVFPDPLKQADIKPVYKKDSRNERKSYRPVSILSNLSKIYERCMYTQMNKYFGPIPSKCQFGFREGYSLQQCLLIITEKWRASLDENGTCAALLTDLSKAFDCLPHNQLIPKLHAYGCNLSSLKLLSCYLRNRR